MTMIRRALRGKVVCIRDGESLTISGSVMGNTLYATVESDVRKGDMIRTEEGTEFEVLSCVKNGIGRRLDHLEASLVPYHE